MTGASLVSVYAPIAEAICLLLAPHAEVVLHDLRTGRIAGIWNPSSRRRVGEPSLLEENEIRAEGTKVLGPYPKAGIDGERIRTVSVILSAPGSDGAGTDATAGLMCINLDVSRLDQAVQLLTAFVAPPREQPPSLFGIDWREQMQTALHGWLRERGLSASSLSREERIAVVSELDSRRLFQTRHAADYVARMLRVSRTSLYNYLRASRKGSHGARART